jgi:tripartite ATP-independent transporter DctM subunit
MATVVYVLIVEGLILREVKWNKVPGIVIESVKVTGAILLIMGIALGFTNFLVNEQIPMKIVAVMREYIPNKIVFLMMLNVLLIIVGCMMDIFSAILVVVPLLVPIAVNFGIDPFHLGDIFLVNLEIGYCTPPIGLNLFVSSLRFKRPVLEFYSATLPFLAFLLVVLLLITYCPFLSVNLVDLLGLRFVF